MTSDVDVQLRSYLETIEASAPPITVDELEHASRRLAGPAHESGDDDLTVVDLRAPVESDTRATQKRWSVVALAVAAAIMLVVGIVVTDSDDNVVTDAASSSAEADPAPPPSEADPGRSLWSLAFLDEAAFRGDGESEMSSLVAGGPGFVAVGGSDGDAAVWTSVDGLTWSRVPHDEAVFGGEGESGMAAVAVGGPGLVAVGSHVVCTEHEVLDAEGSPRVDAVGNPEPDTVCVDGNAVVWTSVDGLTWSRVPHDEAVFGGQRRVYEMNSVTAGGPGLVAVGRSDAFGEGDPLNEGDVNDGDAVVWTSVDGFTWSRIPQDEAVFGGVETQDMLDVTAGGPGLVAVGRDGAGMAWDNPILARGGQHAAVWTSVDGITWARVPHDEAVFDGNGAGSSAMLSVTAGGPGLVAVGEHAGVWASVDGVTWSRVTHDNETEMRGTMVDVAVGGPGLLAVGSGGTGALVWTSPDGLTWSLAANGEPEPGTFHAWMWGVTATNGRLVAVGSLTPSRDSGSAAAAWTNPNP
jgi:hypothetical protein